MVLGELGSALAGALRKLGEHTVVDEEVMDACLKEVTKALLQADVNVQYVVQMKKNIVKQVNIQELAAGLNARKLLEKAVFNELVNMLEGGETEVKEKFVAEEGQTERGHVRRPAGMRQDHDVHQVRLPLAEERIQARARVRRYLQGRCLRSAQAERHQSQDPVLRILHRDGSR